MMSDDPYDYGLLLQDALRGLVRRSLEIAAEQGLHGEHHFYLVFDTQAPGVVMPAYLLESYPEEMTIVLKTQYRDLVVEEDSFSVGLFFGGLPHQLTVPFAALVSFTDPSVDFQLVFPTVSNGEDEAFADGEAEEFVDGEEEVFVSSAPDTEDAGSGESGVAESSSDNVLSFAGFRK